MLYYIASKVYLDTITDAIKEAEEVVYESQTGNEISLLTFLKKNIRNLSYADKILIDLNALNDTEEELKEAIEMYRMMYSESRMILLASNRSLGDQLLTECVALGIYNIITSNDYLVIQKDLHKCLTAGMTFKDASILRNAKNAGVVEKHEIKKNIYKILIGITGVEAHCGVTHYAISQAVWLRGYGYKVAVVEVLNPEYELDKKILEQRHLEDAEYKSAFRCIRENFEESILQEGQFTINGIDYYEAQTVEQISRILERSYNFILLDMGMHEKADAITYQKCDFKFCLCGSRDWEVAKLGNIFHAVTEEALKQYHFVFNFADKETKKLLKDGMSDFAEDHIHFNHIQLNPYQLTEMADGKKIFEGYLPDAVNLKGEKKRGLKEKLFRWKKGKES